MAGVSSTFAPLSLECALEAQRLLQEHRQAAHAGSSGRDTCYHQLQATRASLQGKCPVHGSALASAVVSGDAAPMHGIIKSMKPRMLRQAPTLLGPDGHLSTNPVEHQEQLMDTKSINDPSLSKGVFKRINFGDLFSDEGRMLNHPLLLGNHRRVRSQQGVQL